MFSPEKVCFGVNIVPKAARGVIRVGDRVQVVRRFVKNDKGSFVRPEDAHYVD